jgi:hypothetical protein
VFPLTTPSTLIVGVGSRPGELTGVTKDKDDGAEGALLSPPLDPLVVLESEGLLQEAKEIRKRYIVDLLKNETSTSDCLHIFCSSKSLNH